MIKLGLNIHFYRTISFLLYFNKSSTKFNINLKMQSHFATKLLFYKINVFHIFNSCRPTVLLDVVCYALVQYFRHFHIIKLAFIIVVESFFNMVLKRPSSKLVLKNLGSFTTTFNTSLAVQYSN